MFAPHCPTCARRVLLGTGRIVGFVWDGIQRGAVVRCFCGDLLDANQQQPCPSTHVTSSAQGPHPAQECVLAGRPVAHDLR